MPTVRRAEAEDAGDVARLLHDFNSEFDEFSPGVAVLAERVAKMIAAGEATFLLGGEGPDGIAQLAFAPRSGPERPTPTWKSSTSRRSAAARASGAPCSRPRSRRLARRAQSMIDLGTSEDDTAAIALYESAGFTNREGRPDGPRMLYYEREL